MGTLPSLAADQQDAGAPRQLRNSYRLRNWLERMKDREITLLLHQINHPTFFMRDSVLLFQVMPCELRARFPRCTQSRSRYFVRCLLSHPVFNIKANPFGSFIIATKFTLGGDPFTIMWADDVALI
ncbi:MAG: hypothetical protein R3E79_40175 [Caldilineaceae bacterium]